MLVQECEAYGYPAYGSNYELRVESINEYYHMLINEVLEKEC